jgi:formylmethanofuran dehydrogenase subunit B
MSKGQTLGHMICLGCGCACDDIAVKVDAERLDAVENGCDLGRAWFGDGSVPGAVLAGGRAATIDEALDRATALLAGARMPLVYLAGDLTVEAYRGAVAIADRLRARLDGPASDTVATGLLAQQIRGRATATLGEVLNRADVLVFWGTDPSARYPRFLERYAPAASGRKERGRTGRTIIAVDIGANRGPEAADVRVPLSADAELGALNAIRAQVRGRGPAADQEIAGLTERLTKARYLAIVYDAEPPGLAPDPLRVEALIALTQSLNGPTRAALTALRAGGNRSGVEALMTWQTGFPFAVDFSRGFPRYRPGESASRLIKSGAIDVLLLAGAPGLVPAAVSDGFQQVQLVAIGPRVSELLPSASVVIDTGIAGIHEEGTAYRMDDVPLPLRAALPTARSARETLTALYSRLLRTGGGR